MAPSQRRSPSSEAPKSEAPARELHKPAEGVIRAPEGPDSGTTSSIWACGAAPRRWYDHLKTKWYDLLDPYVKNAYFEHFLGRGLIGASGAKG